MRLVWSDELGLGRIPYSLRLRVLQRVRAPLPRKEGGYGWAKQDTLERVLRKVGCPLPCRWDRKPGTVGMGEA